jgi:hypothetical protein
MMMSSKNPPYTNARLLAMQFWFPLRNKKDEEKDTSSFSIQQNRRQQMDNNHRQQGFDTTVALFVRREIPENVSFSILTCVKDLDFLIEQLGDVPLGRALRDVREHARANAYPENTKVRVGEYRPLAKNATTRGDVGVLKRIKPLDYKEKDEAVNLRKGSVQQKILTFIRRLNRAVTSTEVAEKIGQDTKYASTALSVLTEKGAVKKRKAKEHEKISTGTRFVYEARA